MKIMFYALRPFDEQAYCEPYSKQYGIDYAYTAEVPTPDNLELAKGCDAVSTNPCLITPEYLEAWAAMGVKFLPCRSIGYDHIPQQKAKELGMRISHSWYPPAGVADYAIMLMLMCNRKVGQILRRADAQDYSLNGKMGRDITRMTVGVIGTGNCIKIFEPEYGALVLTLPIGGFITLGCLIALMQYALRKSAEKKEAKEKALAAQEKEAA